MPTTIEPDANGTYLFGPLMVLSACLLSMASSAIWSRNVGETSCGWRTDYSPDGRAFSIWAVIYIGTVVSALTQVIGVLVFDWWVNFFWGLAWVCCAIWVPTFDAEYPSALRTAALVISGSAGFSLAGAWLSQMWVDVEGATRAQKIGTGWPLTLLAGCLLTATSINWGIAFKASNPNTASSCVRVEAQRKGESDSSYRYRRRIAYRESYAKAPAVVSPVPVLLAVVLGGLSAAIPDPILVVPLIWAVVNLKAFPSVLYVFGLVVALGGGTIAVLRLFVWG